MLIQQVGHFDKGTSSEISPANHACRVKRSHPLEVCGGDILSICTENRLPLLRRQGFYQFQISRTLLDTHLYQALIQIVNEIIHKSVLADDRDLILLTYLSVLEETLPILDILKHVGAVPDLVLQGRVALKARLLNLLPILLIQGAAKVEEFTLSWRLLFVCYLFHDEFFDVFEHRTDLWCLIDDPTGRLPITSRKLDNFVPRLQLSFAGIFLDILGHFLKVFGPRDSGLILNLHSGEFLFDVLVLMLHAPWYFDHTGHHLILLLRE